jgi:transposase, IS30 family
MNKVSTAIVCLLKPLGSIVDSITYDNGKEFANHQITSQAIGCMSYFAKPYSSWERGQNAPIKGVLKRKNANGLLRQYFPKKTNLKDVDCCRVKEATDSLNSRPRKCLGYKAPFEVFFNMTGIDVRKLEVVHL